MSYKGICEIVNTSITTPVLGASNLDLVFRTETQGQKMMLANGSNVVPGITLSNNLVGIGKSNPQYALDVNGDVNFSGTLRKSGVPYVGSQWSNNSSNVFILTSNVGIQKSNPAYPLDVNGDVNFSGILRKSGVPYVGSQWSNSSSNVFLINSNVGIGTSNPTNALDVLGNVNIMGTATSSTLYASFGREVALYPPIPLTASSQTVSGQTYGNGAYTVSASALSGIAYNAFRQEDTYVWYTGGYDGTGNYTGATSTSVDGNAVLGEWMQLQLPQSIYLTSYTLRSSTNISENPRSWTIAGSTNGSTWFSVHTVTDTTISAQLTTYTYNITNVSATPYSYFRVITTKNGGGLNVAINEWRFQGSTSTAAPMVGIGTSNPQYALDVAGDVNFSGTLRKSGVPYVGSQWSNNSSNVFLLSSNVGIGTSNPQYALDVVGNINFTGALTSNGVPFASGTVTTSNILFLSGSNLPYVAPPVAMTSNSTVVSGQQNGNGTYIASASSSYGVGFSAYNAFDKSATSSWAISESYAGASFTYTGSYSTLIGSSNIPGNWIQLQMPESVYITSYSISSRTSFPGRCPVVWFVAGSTNGTTWSLLDQRSGYTNWASSNTQTFNVTNNNLYTSIRLCVYQTNGDSLLDVGEISYNVSPLGSFDTSSKPSIAWSNDISTGIYKPGYSNIGFSIGGIPSMFIGSSGNVGIKTTTPQYALDINGYMRHGVFNPTTTYTNAGGTTGVTGSTGPTTISYYVPKGVIYGNASINLDAQFTASASTGNWAGVNVTHNLGTTSYNVIASTGNGGAYACNVKSKAANSFQIQLGNIFSGAQGTYVEVNFQIILY